jgi:hypothetical protein
MDTDWDEEDTSVLEPVDKGAPVTVAQTRLDALCQAVEAILSGRFDEQSLRVQVHACDRFARLESVIQALCEEFLRITGQRRAV